MHFSLYFGVKHFFWPICDLWPNTSLKTHHSYVSAIVHRPLLLYSLSQNITYMRDFVLWTARRRSQYVFIMIQWVNEPTPLNSIDFCTTWRIWDSSTLVVWSYMYVLRGSCIVLRLGRCIEHRLYSISTAECKKGRKWHFWQIWVF